MEAPVMRIAAIDIGTVTTRLMIADVSAGCIDEVERSTDITHLGEGLSATGALSPEAMARVERVVARYAERIAQTGVERTVAVATSASRDASNAPEFSAMLARHGIELSVIPGSREAYLSFLGATAQLEGEALLVVDVGGGSTELVFGHVRGHGSDRSIDIEMARSVDVGSRRVTDLFLASDPPAPEELAAAREWIVSQLRPAFDALPADPHLSLALAGAATSLSAIALGLDPYDPEQVHGSVVSGAVLSDLVESLSSVDLTRRKAVVGLHPDRAGVIVAGALILEMVLALSGLDAFTVSEADILWGILIDAYGEGL